MPNKASRHDHIKNLASRALGVTSQGSETGDAADGPAELNTGEAIELYFAAETSEERDAAFSFIAAQSEPEALSFLAAMMAHDEDVYLRLAAAITLARKGMAEAQAYVVQTLLHATDDVLFEQALEALVASGAPALLQPLAALWRDVERDAGERRMAMLAMERVDPAGALTLWLEDIERTEDVGQLDLERLALALAGLWRIGPDNAEAFLKKLRARAQQAAFADPRDSEALLAVIDDARAVAAAETP